MPYLEDSKTIFSHDTFKKLRIKVQNTASGKKEKKKKIKEKKKEKKTREKFTQLFKFHCDLVDFEQNNPIN